MVTLGQIQMRGFSTLHPEAIKDWLKSCATYENTAQWSMLEALEMFDAYLTITEFNPDTVCSDDLAGLRGFLNIEMGLIEEVAKGITLKLCDMIIALGILSEEKISFALKESSLECNEKYAARQPSKSQLLIYKSLFPTMEPDGVVYVDFLSLGSALNESSLQFLSSLLSQYFASLTTEQAETDAGLIIGLTQGLLHQNPSVDLGDISLSIAKSTSFISCARIHAEWQMHNAGYFRGDAYENWKLISGVILNFFVANNILHLSKAGRQLLVTD
ncbi:hypothetical protein [Pseudomonas shahriarae]|uniref:Uncharacterized protein n=1 Tax=Pseudomonas shahriarae TaxID=2745512 RepID=A0ABT5NGZ4_9PSED|nr:hypothetical protein [Pseudomonas shahriarae]MDD0987808.1 hypothetical protein [Pseudomonas shahriarae]MDD1032519.1 hypothetical protein [Pseudomonas shahriarae]